MQPHRFIIGIGLVALFITAGLSIMFGNTADLDDSFFEFYNDTSDNIVQIDRSKFSKMDSGGEASAEAVYNLTREQEEELIAQEVEEELGWEVLIVGPYRMIQRLPT